MVFNGEGEVGEMLGSGRRRDDDLRVTPPDASSLCDIQNTAILDGDDLIWAYSRLLRVHGGETWPVQA
jgi:hypothetical protein